MDQKTRDAYLTNAQSYSDDWLSQPQPTDMYLLLQKYFRPGGKTADVGCGNGRDANWLRENGYDVLGFDSSEALIEIASKHFPLIQFKVAQFPLLSEIDDQFENILCETVLMHLEKNLIPEAIQSLKRILKDDGILYLSWRVTEGEDARHADGRLYSAFTPEFVLDQFAKENVLHFEDQTSASSGKRVCRLIWKK